MKVLVVVDMQKDFIDGALGSKEAQAIVESVVKKIEKFDGDLICLTKDTHPKDYLKHQEGSFLPVEHCIQGTDGHRMNAEVAEVIADSALNYRHRKTVQIFEKETFGSVELGEYLKQHGATEIEIIGLCTDKCVIANAILLKAFLPEASIIVDAKCCAGTSAENHIIGLKAMSIHHIHVENWEDL